MVRLPAHNGVSVGSIPTSSTNTTARQFKNMAVHYNDAGMVELADTPDLGSGAARRGGSSPSTRTIVNTV